MHSEVGAWGVGGSQFDQISKLILRVRTERPEQTV